MPLRQVGQFVHRLQLDGTFDSICLHCFCTAVRSKQERTLELEEKFHRCDPATLRRLELFNSGYTRAMHTGRIVELDEIGGTSRCTNP
jgi:hypothetical protein